MVNELVVSMTARTTEKVNSMKSLNAALCVLSRALILYTVCVNELGRCQCLGYVWVAIIIIDSYYIIKVVL